MEDHEWGAFTGESKQTAGAFCSQAILRMLKKSWSNDAKNHSRKAQRSNEPVKRSLVWLDDLAEIAVTSESADAPVESIFDPDSQTGWRAGEPGVQVIRITFGEPKTIRRIQLAFRELHSERTQEFTLHCSTATGGHRTEIVRQQWTFSPRGSTREVEDFRLNVSDALVVELTINPNLNDTISAYASLVALHIG